MNMFKKSRRAKEQEGALNALSGSDNAPLSKASRALTRKKKKNEVAEVPVFDLSSALPDNKDFRTSLMMPNLSARFSMLREQDDPSTKIGKASDDSVLFPKRASRLLLFSNSQLTDIAEVESVYSSFRPPFADERNGSISDGYASDDGGSMMNRTRPGEGNVLFGGRQKLYRIATGSSKNLPNEGGMTRGKHMYENDVSLSAFQQVRLKEKEQREQQQEFDEKTDRSSFPITDIDEQDSSRSPLTAFSRKRGTQSSTNSGPSNHRTSTAATSVVSDTPLSQQSSNATVNKIKEQGINSSAESIGFASSPSFRKVREDNVRPPFRQVSQSRSASNIRESYSRQSPVPFTQASRGMSPPLSASPQKFNLGLRDTTSSQVAASRCQTASPTSPFEFGTNETLAVNVRPNDHGKATAMGLFNKPASQFDEAQFQQRQMQMHEGRNSPLSVSSRAASRASPEPRSARPSYASASSPMPQDDSYNAPQIPQIPEHPPSPMSNGRSSASSSGRRSLTRLRAKSSTSVKEASMKARAESLIRNQNAELAALEATHFGSSRSPVSDERLSSPQKAQTRETFFDNSDESDDEAGQRRPSIRSIGGGIPPPSPPSDVHPALRKGLQEFDFGPETRRPSQPQSLDHSASSKIRSLTDKHLQSEQELASDTEDVDILALPTAGLGLSGLIRTHLRHDSDRSCVMPPPSLAQPVERPPESLSSTTPTVTEAVKSDLTEHNDNRLNISQPSSLPELSPTPTSAMSLRAQQILDTAKALRAAQMATTDAIPEVDATSEETSQQSMQIEPDMNSLSHQRNESTETQREQQRFDKELAERRKRVEEGLKSVQERSRSRSPIAERTGATSGHGFSLPRFPGRSNTGDRAESQSKAMKMLGITSMIRDLPSSRITQDSPPPDNDRSRGVFSHHGQRPPTAQDYERSNGRDTPDSGRRGPHSGLSNGHERPLPPRSATPTSKAEQRSRSSSTAAERSASRGRHIPGFDRSMMPGAFPPSPFANSSPFSEFGQRSESPANRSYERSGSSAADNYTEKSGYFNVRSLASPNAGNGFTPRPSPRPSPNPGSDSAVPMSPSSAMPSSNPMSNGRITPQAVSRRGAPSGYRKQSVTKGMISDPKFVSSTSSVPLVYLPRDGGPQVDPVTAPPLPVMNPRRRGNTAGDQSDYTFSPHPAIRPIASPLPEMPESPNNPDFSQSRHTQAQPDAGPQNKLREVRSEGGNMAARARQQAFAAEMAREKDRTPNVAAFPNEITTSVTKQDGGMF